MILMHRFQITLILFSLNKCSICTNASYKIKRKKSMNDCDQNVAIELIFFSLVVVSLKCL